MKPKLIIIEKKPTQFDVPLYDYLSRKASFNLMVYYTQTHIGTDDLFDPEIQRVPAWDHLGSCEYFRKDLKKDETVKAVVDEIAGFHPDLVIFCGYFPVFHAKLAWLLKKKGCRIGLRSDNTMPHSNFSGVKGVVKKQILPSWLKLYDTWHPVGSLARQYLEKISAAKRPTYFFPYNVDNDWFARESTRHRQERDVLREKIGFSPDDRIVLGIMKWNDREDPLTLIDAFVWLRKRCQNARLILVGDGPLRDVVHAKTECLRKNIFLPGYISYSGLPKYYGISDVFVHPAVHECWGVSVNEAMACGLPVVAAGGVGSGTDLIVEGITGATYPNHDSESLFNKLMLMMKDHELLVAMGRAAQQKISGWSYEQTQREFERALETNYC